jgi:hypothetical protein
MTTDPLGQSVFIEIKLSQAIPMNSRSAAISALLVSPSYPYLSSAHRSSTLTLNEDLPLVKDITTKLVVKV